MVRTGVKDLHRPWFESCICKLLAVSFWGCSFELQIIFKWSDGSYFVGLYEENETRGMIIGAFKPFQQVLFPFPLCFQAPRGRSWESPFPLVNRHLITPILESCVGLSAAQGAAPNARRSGSLRPPLGAGTQFSTIAPRDCFPPCPAFIHFDDACSSQERQQPRRAAWRKVHWLTLSPSGRCCSIAKRMTFREFGNLLLCGGRETKKFKLKLYIK